MEKMIYYFGDSHTAGIGSEGSPKPDIWYHVPYSKYLTDLLNIKSKNFAVPGQNFVVNVIELIKNLNDIENNASIVLFQTQFFCNSILKYDDKNFNVKDLIIDGNVSDSKNEMEVYENLNLGITKEDSVTLLNWSTKFEERRSLYELDIVIGIFDYLKTKGIKCYLLYWSAPFDITLPDNEYVIKFHKGPMAASDTEKRLISFKEITNGEWEDYHSTNEWNQFLSEKIYKFINNH